ncbi:MAG: AI-2E family transporter [Tractidigestivibacter sp.]|uniref:AI-2E family transporter n=1 Tax=Tractidigestivibacter sp. TaxID=2847320 RepID=UPI002A814097|nr:AI-2E family transporter [Tractidigestivibacter sp.]MDY4534078.1 AI-2E family transporter [Tractidigestivibacter sp.]
MENKGVGEKYAAWRRRLVVAWAIVGAIVAIAFALRGLSMVGDAVELLLMGIVMGFICSPITNALEDRRVPRALAALVSLLAVLAALAAVVVVLGGTFVQQSVEVLRQVPSYVRGVQDALSGFWGSYGTSDNEQLQSMVNSVVQTVSSAGSSFASDTVRQLSSGAVTGLFDTLDNLVNFFLALVLAYWFAKDYPVIVRELAVVAGPSRKDDVTLLLAVMSRSMGGYMRGQLICSVINSLAAWVGLALLGHPYAGLVAIITFFMHFVPVIGPFASAALATLLALFESPWLALWSLVAMAVAANVTDNVISPLIMRSAVKIHPVLSIVGIVIGNCLGGIVGMVLAIPLTAAIRGVFVYHFETRTGRQLVSEGGALFQSTPHHDGAGNVEAVYDALDDEKFFESTRLVTSSAWSDAHKAAAHASNDHENAVCAADMSKNRNVAANRQDDIASSVDRSLASSTDEERHERV